MNRITIIGNVGKEPVTKAFNENQGVTNFSVATTKKWLGKDKQWQSKTTWHNVTAWQNVKLPALTKGDRVFVEGEMNFNINAETKQCYPSIVASEVHLIIKNKVTPEQNMIPDCNMEPTENFSENDIPF